MKQKRSLMSAAFYKRPRPASAVLNVDELTIPEPAFGEVRVHVLTSGINPADVKRRNGEAGRPLGFPIIIPHSDGAGIIEAVGAGVKRSREGEAVWLWNTQWRRPFGTAAEFAVVPSIQAVRLPQGVAFDLGASLGVPALTPHRCVSALGDIRDRPILISGASGAVGQLAVQFAKARGAVVTATVGAAPGVPAALACADHCLEYRAAGFLEAAERAAGAGRYHAIIDVDAAANARTYTRLLARHGTVVVYGSGSNMTPSINVLELRLHGVTMKFVSGSEQTSADRDAAIDEISNMVADGALTMNIEDRFELKDIVPAHERVEAGRLAGKVLLQIRQAVGSGGKEFD